VVVLVQRPPLVDHHAVRLGEQMLNESATVEEFNEMLKSRCLPANNGNEETTWRQDEFTKAKEQIASGEGLGANPPMATRLRGNGRHRLVSHKRGLAATTLTALH
jgi:hypothetical protein